MLCRHLLLGRDLYVLGEVWGRATNRGRAEFTTEMCCRTACLPAQVRLRQHQGEEMVEDRVRGCREEFSAAQVVPPVAVVLRYR